MESLHVAAWPWVQEMHQIVSRHYAFEGRAFVLAAGAVLQKRDLPDDFLQRGGSAIIGPNGAYLARPL